MAKQDISIRTEDGTARAGLFRPSHPTTAGVILYMDAFGPRPALDAMAERLADEGYAVLVPDLFYRFGDYGPFDARTAFSEEPTRTALRSMIDGTSQDMTCRDTATFLDALTQAGATGRIGAVGYCMGGSRAIRAAAAYPDRIAAAASFHGGRLASDAPDSPHRHVSSIKGRVYVGSAGVDGSFPPEQSALLAEALRRAETDHSVYDERGAERHWKRLLTFFEETLR
ncbi:dienelactone hydrolase family protein [Microvirga sp. CF3016]|uniref:dienelactone hydrolase family protein n=1 Tax=Microvirga sp. CF3016 TaxID=3110181 RepID=UPI002E782852|nr:dienelactone hydrolase family protein [Microvirga sp. CF3016]MEE1612910.1 dienelactone hydrolase family protein [Microvirga sp. CF3016]